MSDTTESVLAVGLDIGTHSIVAMVGEIDTFGAVTIVGAATIPTANGVKKGLVVNTEIVAQQIEKVIAQVEDAVSCQVHSVFTCISGSHIKGMTSQGVVAIRNHDVSETDIAYVIETARAVPIPPEQKILHTLPQGFMVDQRETVRNPLGMPAIRLEVQVYIITCQVAAAQGHVRAIRRARLEVDDVLLQGMAVSRVVLNEEEKNQGVCLIHIGAGTTELLVYDRGFLRHVAVIPVAGDQVTNDIAVVKRISIQLAEKLKCNHGACLASSSSEEEDIQLTMANGTTRIISRQLLVRVMESRYDELLQLVKAELKRQNLLHMLHAGFVFTGGGAQVSGLIELAEDIFHLPVRIGSPIGVGGDSALLEQPIYAVAIGLLAGLRGADSSTGLDLYTPREPAPATTAFSKIKKIVRSYF